MKKSQAVLLTGASLITAERAIDTAFKATAQLAADMSHARLEANISAVVGQDAFDEICETLASLGRSRAALVRTHGRLDDVRTQIGCRTIAAGGEDKYPQNQARLALKSVGDEQAIAA